MRHELRGRVQFLRDTAHALTATSCRRRVVNRGDIFLAGRILPPRRSVTAHPQTIARSTLRFTFTDTQEMQAAYRPGGRFCYSNWVLAGPRRAITSLSLVGLFVVALAAAGCSDDASTCVEELGESCQPLYSPVYTEVFERTIRPRCALEGGSCHSREGAQGGLIMEEIDSTYQALVTDGRVSPGDTACSLLLVRVAGGGGGVMPPGAPLSEAERCALETWVRNGAER